MRITHKSRNELQTVIRDKSRILIYGAGEYALSVFETISELTDIDILAIVDKEYVDCANAISKVGGVQSVDDALLTYNADNDIIIWAIASPRILREKLEHGFESIDECILIWDMWGVWNNSHFAQERIEDFTKVSDLLCDAKSKEVLKAYLLAMTGDISADIMCATEGTYFNELTDITRGGAFVDCGSFDGRDSEEFLKRFGQDRIVFAFEPDKNNYQSVLGRIGERNGSYCINKGVWSEEGVLSFSSKGDMSSSLDENGEETVDVTTIDSVSRDEKVAFIKMDVEGAEYEALLGAKSTITRDMPILAISAYHRQEDLITLIPYIASLGNSEEKYDVYLRHHGVVATELVIYGLPVKIDN